MGWIVEGIIYWLVDLVQALMGLFVGVYEDINIDIGYDITDTSPDTLFSYTFFSEDAKLKGLFDDIFSQAHLFMDVFVYLAYVIVLIIFVFKLYHAMITPDDRDTENVWKLTGRFFLSLFLVTWSYSIFIYMEKIAQVLFEEFKQSYSVVEGTARESFSDNISAMALGSNMFASGLNGIRDVFILILIIGIFVTMLWQYCRLLLEIVERYVLLGVMFYTCPLAFVAITSDSTKKIFSNWLQMLLTQFLIMMMNLFFVGVFVSSLDNVYSPVGKDYAFASVGDFIVRNFCLIALLIIAQKIDQHLRDLGLSAIQAGAGLAGAMLSTLGTVATITKPVVKAATGVASDLGKAAVKTASSALPHNAGAAAAGAAGAAAAGTAAAGAANAVSAAGTPQNAAKVDNLVGRDPNTGNLTKSGVKEALDGGATLTGQDAKQAAEIMGLNTSQFANSEDIDWNKSQINRDGAILTSKSDPTKISSHIGFGSDWQTQDHDGTQLAQVAVPTAEGFADGTRAMTETDLHSANRQVLDALTNPNTPATSNLTWSTPEGESITDDKGNYSESALNSPYFVGRSPNGENYVAGTNNVNDFDLDRGSQITSSKTAAHGNHPSYEYSVQKIDTGKEASVLSSKSVIRTDAQSTNMQSDFIMRKKEPTPMPQEKVSAAKQTYSNFKDIRKRRKR